MPDLSKLPVTVITGFLGAGKTTLIRHLMQNPQGKRLAVVVNEFGDVGIDGEILEGADIDMVELNSGCLCCTLKGPLLNAIEELKSLEDKYNLKLTSKKYPQKKRKTMKV